VQLSVEARERLAQVWVAAVSQAVASVEAPSFARLEQALETAVRQAGAESLSVVLAEAGTGYVGRSRPCVCGGEQSTDHYASCQRQTLLGTVRLRRAAYRCPQCGRRECPLDATLGMPPTATSPQLQARLSLFCAVAPFAEACALLEVASGVRVSAKRAQVVSEALGCGVEAAGRRSGPGVATVAPAPDRLYLGLDGIMYCSVEPDPDGGLLWREAKVGVFATPKPRGAPGTGRRSRLAPDGLPIDALEPISQRYVAHLGPWRAFASKVWQEGQRWGLEQAQEIVVLSDGAEWINAVVAEILMGLPGQVTHILDIRHAQEHLWAVARACLGEQTLGWVQAPLAALREGRVDDLVAAVRALPTPTAEAAGLAATTVAYYQERRAQMAYPTFRAQGLEIGSGLAESGCKRLIGQRIKEAGMHWTVAGAQAIATLRAAYLSGRWPEVVDLACAS
jgi:hypothetical protein